jgi:hypothetical protein
MGGGARGFWVKHHPKTIIYWVNIKWNRRVEKFEKLNTITITSGITLKVFFYYRDVGVILLSFQTENG